MMSSSNTGLRQSSGVGSAKRVLWGIIILGIVIGIIVLIDRKDTSPNLNSASTTTINPNLLNDNPGNTDAVVSNNPSLPNQIALPTQIPSTISAPAPIADNIPTNTTNNSLPQSPSFGSFTQPTNLNSKPNIPAPLPFNSPKKEEKVTSPSLSTSNQQNKISSQASSHQTSNKTTSKPSSSTIANISTSTAMINPSKDVHTVTKGDTLGKISLKYYKSLKYVDELAKYNNIEKNEHLHVNQQIKLPTLPKLTSKNSRSNIKNSRKTNDLNFSMTENGEAKLVTSNANNSSSTENYKVLPNENLIKISKKKNINFLTLYDLNKDVLPDGDPDKLDAGMIIRIPLAKSK